VFERGAIVWTQDPADLKSYINQLRRWYGGGWQNLLKHRQTAAVMPACAFELSMIFIEGILFALTLLILPFVNLKVFALMAAVHLLTTTILGILAAIRRRRLDLALYSPLYIVLAVINSYIFCEQFLKEVIMRERNLYWFTPKRRE
jgi:cellulose synthase/poly-beta-1,6-N-acetylglucosamine synthase-like glycosyltransferase